MAYITKPSSFVGERYIPNTTDQAVSEKINTFIAKYEPRCLKLIFGYDLYQVYLSGLPIVSGSRFDKLINGVNYVDDFGNSANWPGVKQMLVDYIYFYLMKDSVTSNTGKGTVLLQSEKTFNISPAQKMVDAWNEFYESVARMVSFLMADSNAGIYEEFTYDTYMGLMGAIRPINEFDI